MMLFWWQIPASFGAHPVTRMANYQRHLEVEAEVNRRIAERDRGEKKKGRRMAQAGER